MPVCVTEWGLRRGGAVIGKFLSVICSSIQFLTKPTQIITKFSSHMSTYIHQKLAWSGGPVGTTQWGGEASPLLPPSLELPPVMALAYRRIVLSLIEHDKGITLHGARLQRRPYITRRCMYLADCMLAGRMRVARAYNDCSCVAYYTILVAYIADRATTIITNLSRRGQRHANHASSDA